MKRSAIIAITLALASAAVAAPNGLGQATNPNRAMRSGFAPRQRNNITNDIENARANAKRDFIRSQDEYKAIDSRAEEKFKLILEDNCRNWKAGCGKGVIISDGNSNSIVYGEDGRLLEISSWEDLQTTKWIKSEQQRVEQSIIETKSAEIAAAEDAAEKAVRDRYAEQEAKRKADEEKRVAEQKAKEEQRKIDDEKRAADRKAQDDKLAAERKAERERQETERQNAKAHDEAEALRKENLLRQFFFEQTGLKLGIITNDLPGSVKSTWQSDVVIIDLPRTFRHYKTAEARFISGIIYEYSLPFPFDNTYSEESRRSEFNATYQLFREFIPNKRMDGESNLELFVVGYNGRLVFKDKHLQKKLEQTEDAKKKKIPEL